MKKIKFAQLFSYTMLAAVILLTAYSLFLTKYGPAPERQPTIIDLSKPDVDPEIKKAVPDAVKVEQISQNPWVIKIIKADDSTMYGAIGNGDGHQSKISVLVIMSPDHKIANVSILSQGETPSKFAKLESNNFLSRFTGKSVETNFTAGQNIDTISGATNSSTGVIAAVKNASAVLKSIQ